MAQGPALFEILLEPDVISLHEQLWIAMDVNGDGTIDAADFEASPFGDWFVGQALWKEFKTTFDHDHGGGVDPTEFFNGFINETRKKVITPTAYKVTFGAFQDQMAVQVNAWARENVQALAGKIGEMLAGAKDRISRQQALNAGHSNVVFTGRFRQDVLVEMEGAFNHLHGQDTPASEFGHSITAESFQAAGATMGSWAEVLKYFDDDNSGTIEATEFIEGFRRWIQDEQLQVPAGNMTVLQFMEHITKSANELVLVKLGEFKTTVDVTVVPEGSPRKGRGTRSMGFDHFKKNEFKLERYFAKYEFTARYLLCSSDCESLSLQETLASADTQSRAMWENLSLGYTESNGSPALREEIAKLYTGIEANGVLVGAPQELILIGLSAEIEPGDHVLVTWPGYQSLYETCVAAGADVDFLNVAQDGFDLLAEIKKKEKPNTKAVVLNLPHNPTGYLPTKQEMETVMSFVKRRGWLLFSDEMYRFLEHNPADRLPAACESDYSRTITLCGLSKSMSMPGLRLGWLATRDPKLLTKMIALKDYTTICPPAPSEVLAIMALRNREIIVATNMRIIQTNMRLLTGFFEQYADMVTWTPPKAGSICFPVIADARYKDALGMCKKLVAEHGVMLLPGDVYSRDDVEFPLHERFRLGFGRKNMKEALEEFGSFLDSLRK